MNDLIDDLSESQIAELFKWKKFYEDTYTFVGLLEGSFFDSEGKKTQLLLDAELKYAEFEKVLYNYLH